MTIRPAYILLLSVLVTSFAAADMAGSKDHPLVSRYQGSEILKYEQRAFDAAVLLKGPVSKSGGPGKHSEAYLTLEGKVTRIAYRAPSGRSTLEVARNYEQALASGGFQVLYSCANERCSPDAPNGGPFNQAATPPDLFTTMAYNEKDQRYLLARLPRPHGDAYVSLYLARAYSIGGENKDRIFINQIVVEAEPLQTGMVKVDAAAMTKGLDAEGHIALYEIFFDSDKAELRPESGAALDEIAKLLKSRPALKVLIVGHTDNVGELTYNQSLSEKRAKSVVETLVAKNGITRERLTPVGVGMAAPVASNDTEAGRAKNRRVELVKYR